MIGTDIGYNIAGVVILLGILVFVHELGHFLVAKASGVGVLKFSLGFGPKLIGRKFGETEYLISAIPLGGYVKMLGESDRDTVTPEDEKRSFLKQSLGKRMAIVAAGPVFNFLFAIVAFAAIHMVGMPVLTTQIGGIQPGSAAEEAGFQAKDIIEAINGRNVTVWNEIAPIITKSKGKELSVRVVRNGAPRDVKVVPKMAKGRNIFGEEVDSYMIGISPSPETVIQRQNPARAVWSGLEQTWTLSELTVLSVVKMIEGVVSPKTLGGPILIAQMAGAQVKKGIVPFVFLMALLSINLGILNLFPIPILDGGHLFFNLIELLTGKEVNVKWRELAQQVGFVLIIMLMLFVFYNDILRIFND